MEIMAIESIEKLDLSKINIKDLRGMSRELRKDYFYIGSGTKTINGRDMQTVVRTQLDRVVEEIKKRGLS